MLPTRQHWHRRLRTWRVVHVYYHNERQSEILQIARMQCAINTDRRTGGDVQFPDNLSGNDE